MDIKILATSIISNLIIGAGLFFFHILAPKLALMIMVAVVAGLASIFISMFIEHSMQKALWYHCRKGNTAQALQYMTAGANINKPNSFGSTALHVATYSNNAEIIQKLIAVRANPDTMDTSRRTPLHLAVLYDKENAAMALIPKTQNIDRPSTNGNTALLLATEQGRHNLVEALIQAGANVNILNRQGFTPLHNAAYMGRIGAINLLIQAGADFHATDQFGKTPLHITAQKGHPETAAALIENGANPNATGSMDHTPLHWAVRKGYTEIAIALINAGANPNATDRYGETALHLAACNDHPETAAALIENGANPNATDRYGKTALHLAACNDHPETAAALIENGANLNATQFGTTPLQRAIKLNKLATALAIISYGKVSGGSLKFIKRDRTSNRTNQCIRRLYTLANYFRERSYTGGFFSGMNASFREAMLAGMKIHFMATGIKDGYLTIMNLLRDQSPSGKLAPSSLPYEMLSIILEYTGHWSSSLKINLQDLMIGHTSAEVLKSETPYGVILTHQDRRFPETVHHNPAAAA